MADLRVSELYSAMLRPPMWLGLQHAILPYLFTLFIIFYIGLNPIYGICSLPFLYCAGWLACMFDPDFSKVLLNYTKFTSVHMTNKKLKIRSYRA